MLVALDRAQHRLGLAQFAALGQAARVENQCRGVLVVVGEQLLEQAFRLADATLGEQCLGAFQQVRLGRGWLLDVGFEHGADGGFGLGTGEAVYRLAVLEQHHGGQAAHAEAGDHFLFDIAIDLGQQQLALVLLGDLRQHRHQRLARRTPFGPEIHQHRLVKGVLQDQLLEVAGGDVEDEGSLAHQGSRMGACEGAMLSGGDHYGKQGVKVARHQRNVRAKCAVDG